MKEYIQAWRERIHEKRIASVKSNLSYEAEKRYNFVSRDGETYLTFDGIRISTDYGKDYKGAVEELLNLRAKYINEQFKEYIEND